MSTLQELFESWWEVGMVVYGESFGSTARLMAKSLPQDAQRYASELDVELTVDMAQAIKRGYLR